MLVVDSSVWIDFFNGAANEATAVLEELLEHGEVRLVVPDLVLFEVLRGFRHERDHREARQLLEALDVEPTCDPAIAVAAAQHYRSLRQQGVTPRSAIDVLVATFCIERAYVLLHRDRDFHAFEEHRGLRGWQHCHRTRHRASATRHPHAGCVKHHEPRHRRHPRPTAAAS